jgi:hypothetical protein
VEPESITTESGTFKREGRASQNTKTREKNNGRYWYFDDGVDFYWDGDL